MNFVLNNMSIILVWNKGMAGTLLQNWQNEYCYPFTISVYKPNLPYFKYSNQVSWPAQGCFHIPSVSLSFDPMEFGGTQSLKNQWKTTIKYRQIRMLFARNF